MCLCQSIWIGMCICMCICAYQKYFQLGLNCGSRRGLSAAAKAAAISGAIIAAVVICGVIVLVLVGVGAKKTVDMVALHNAASAKASENPMYKAAGSEGENMLYGAPTLRKPLLG